MKKIIQKIRAEEATGLNENPSGLGTIYNGNGGSIADSEAREIIAEGGVIEVPNAGAGSYARVFAMLGYDRVEVIDWTSSAGDWCFGVRKDNLWYRAFQENRYPHHGMKYAVNVETPFPSFKNAASI